MDLNVTFTVEEPDDGDMEVLLRRLPVKESYNLPSQLQPGLAH